MAKLERWIAQTKANHATERNSFASEPYHRLNNPSLQETDRA